MKTITGSATWSATASVPVAGERPCKSIHIESPVQTVLNNTKFLKHFGSWQIPLTFERFAYNEGGATVSYGADAAVDLDCGGCILWRRKQGGTIYESTSTPFWEGEGPLVTGDAADEAYRTLAAATSGSSTGSLRARLTLAGAGLNYLFERASNASVVGTWSTVTTSLAESTEPATPGLLWEPVNSKFWARIGQYVLRFSGTPTVELSEDCGCGAPATSKPRLGVYNTTAVVGYYSTTDYCHTRVKVDSGAWAAGGTMYNDSGTLYVIVIGYDPVSAKWVAVLSNGYVYTTTNLATNWTFTSTGSLSGMTVERGWIVDGRLIVQASSITTTRHLFVSEDLGVTWQQLTFARGSSDASDGFVFGGRRIYFTKTNGVLTVYRTPLLVQKTVVQGY